MLKGRQEADVQRGGESETSQLWRVRRNLSLGYQSLSRPWSQALGDHVPCEFQETPYMLQKTPPFCLN